MSTEIIHDPREYVRGLQQILISDSKRVGFLFGAGTSLAIKRGGSQESKVPAVKEMTERIINSITKPEFMNALEIIKKEFDDGKINFNIEYILSNITQKEQVVGREKLCGLSKSDFQELRQLIENEIIGIVSVHKKYHLFMDNLIHCDFTQWIIQASRKYPIEIFTTNYDYLFELGLEYHNVPYFDGFVGSFEPFFNQTSVEDLAFAAEYTKLWKIHGSLGWYFNEDNKKVIRKHPDDSNIMVYPSLLKYDNSKKQPYVSFIDRLGKFVQKDDTVLFVCGYSFGDQHINAVIVNALKKASTSHVMGFYFDDLVEDSDIVRMAKNQPKMSIYSRNYAVIGGKYGRWKLRNEPDKEDSILIDLYFDENFATPSKEQGKDEYNWTGEGDFKLQGFNEFVEFLSFLNYGNSKFFGDKR